MFVFLRRLTRRVASDSDRLVCDMSMSAMSDPETQESVVLNIMWNMTELGIVRVALSCRATEPAPPIYAMLCVVPMYRCGIGCQQSKHSIIQTRSSVVVDEI